MVRQSPSEFTSRRGCPEWPWKMGRWRCLDDFWFDASNLYMEYRLHCTIVIYYNSIIYSLFRIGMMMHIISMTILCCKLQRSPLLWARRLSNLWFAPPRRYIWFRVPCCPPPPPPMVWVPPPPPIPHAFCTRHCSETYISILLHARRCSETHIFILLDEPSRRIRWVDRAKLWRNANFKLQEWLRAVYRTLQCSANGIIYIYISMYIHIHKHQ